MQTPGGAPPAATYQLLEGTDDAPDLLRSVLDHPSEASAVLSVVAGPEGQGEEWRFREANANALALLKRDRQDVLGRPLSEVLPDRAGRIATLCRSVLDSRKPLHYGAELGGRSYEMLLFAVGADAVLVHAQDITSRITTERQREALVAAYRAEKEWLTAVLDSIGEEVYFVDAEQRYTYVNTTALREFRHGSVVGRPLRDVVAGLEVYRADGTARPLSEAPPLRALAGEVVRGEEQVVLTPRTGERRHRLVTSSPVRDPGGRIIGSVSIVRDVTEQRRAERALRLRDERTAALLRLSDLLRDASDPDDIALTAATVLGETLGITRCGYGTLETGTGSVSIRRLWSQPRSPRLAGGISLREYGSFVDELEAGVPVRVADAAADPRTAGHAEALQRIGVRALLALPIMERGQVVAMFFLMHEAPRAWSGEDVAFVRDVADRTRSAVERRRNEQAIEAELRLTRVLQELSARIVADEDADTLLDEVLSAALLIMAADTATLQLLDESTQELHLAATLDAPEELVSRFRTVGADSGTPCGIALARGERTFMDYDVPEDQDPDGAARLHLAHGLRSGQSTPLVNRSGRAIGMLSTHWRYRHTPDERELRFLDLLARQVADHIEKTRSRQELRAADRRKDEFLALLAHELRNPLAPICNGLEVLARAGDVSQAFERVRPMLERQTLQLVHLLDDLLDVSRITLGRIQLKREAVTLGEILGGAVDDIRPAAEAAGLALGTDVAEPGLRLLVDPTRVGQILTNLLGNATRFTPAGGWIRVSARVYGEAEAREVEIKVRDSGIGIEPELLPRMFDLFAQAEQAGYGKQGGLGIGLALARSLAELHGGRLTGSSAGTGRGSEFTLRLPVVGESSGR